MYIKRGDLEKYGFAERCPGYRSVLTGVNQQTHCEAFRKRIPNVLGRDDPRVVANEENIQEVLAMSIEESVKKKARSAEALSEMRGGAMMCLMKGTHRAEAAGSIWWRDSCCEWGWRRWYWDAGWGY